MATIPKYRPSLSLPQLELIMETLSAAPATPLLEETKQALSLFLFKIGAGINSPSYIPSRASVVQAPAPETILDSTHVDYSTPEAQEIAYKNIQIAKSLGVTSFDPAELAAAQAWMAENEEPQA